jgi:hypothetical protein
LTQRSSELKDEQPWRPDHAFMHDEGYFKVLEIGEIEGRE